MNKYIDADELVAGLKHLQERFEFPTYESIYHLIDSLQQEQPEVDLREIIERTYHDGSVADTSDIDHVDYENIACHFYELGLNARKEK